MDRCPHCKNVIVRVLSHNLWTVHKACLWCDRLYVVFRDGVYDCQTPQTCAPRPWLVVEPLPPYPRPVQPGPQGMGLL